jgi:peroxiredoxin
VAAVAAACLIGFVVFVIVRGSPHPATVGSAALEVPPPPVLRVGTSAPAFSLPALQGGSSVSLSAFRGKPVILNFFASWCRDCRAELGAVARVARATSGRLTVVGVDSNETSTATAMQLLAAAGATYPVAVDAQAKVASEYLVQALPVSYFLNGSGQVVGAALGPQSVASLEHWVARLGAGR